MEDISTLDPVRNQAKECAIAEKRNENIFSPKFRSVDDPSTADENMTVKGRLNEAVNQTCQSVEMYLRKLECRSEK